MTSSNSKAERSNNRKTNPRKTNNLNQKQKYGRL
jgi:hypothetical protein